MEATRGGRSTAWALLVALGAANAAGYVLDLYQRFWRFDRIPHGCTILALTLWLAVFVCRRVLGAAPAGRSCSC